MPHNDNNSVPKNECPANDRAVGASASWPGTTHLETLLPKIFDLLLDPVCVVDEHGYFVHVSAACERLFGYTQEELIGRPVLDLVHPDDRERTRAAAANIMRNRPHLNFENRYIHKDGRIVHIRWSATWSEEDRLRLAVARDVTALKHAEDVQRALYRISEAAHANDSLADLCADIHGIIGELVPAANFEVVLHDSARNTLSWPYCTIGGDFVNRDEQPLDGNPRIAALIRSGQSTLTIAGAPDPTGPEGTTAKMDWLGAPLVTPRGTIGALILQGDPGTAHYNEDDAELLRFVSAQVTTALVRKQAETRLRHLAHHDPLTDLPNRAVFEERVDSALAAARSTGEQHALLFLDLNDFKAVNDAHGHEIGDHLLTQLSARLRDCVRESDTLGRMGGDEFTVLITGIENESAAHRVVERIHSALDKRFDLGGLSLKLSASIGVALFPRDGDDRESLMRHADAEMYAAKGDKPPRGQ